MQKASKELPYENRFNYCTLLARSSVHGIWPQWLSPLHPPAPPSDPLALQFLVAVSASHFAAFFFAVQVVGGLLLLFGYFVPLALILLAAELYNILAFHLMFQSGSGRTGIVGLCPLGVGLPPISCKTSTASLPLNRRRSRRPD
jgi:hypothetical protein